MGIGRRCVESRISNVVISRLLRTKSTNCDYLHKHEMLRYVPPSSALRSTRSLFSFIGTRMLCHVSDSAAATNETCESNASESGKTVRKKRTKKSIAEDGVKASTAVGEAQKESVNFANAVAVPTVGEQLKEIVDAVKAVKAVKASRTAKKKEGADTVRAADDATAAVQNVDTGGEVKTPPKRKRRKRTEDPVAVNLDQYFQIEEQPLVKEEEVAAPALPQIVQDDYSDPTQVFQIMLEYKGHDISPEDKESLKNILERFSSRGWARNQALALYVNSKFFPATTSKFRKFLTNKCPPKLREVLVAVGASDAIEEYLFPIYAEFCIHEFSPEITRYRELVTSADLTKPHAWFPFTRAMRRKVVYHCGPTNSGKTYTALQTFMKAENGIYCCPLRLLAMEIYDKSNTAGVYCSLHTGQERRDVPFWTHLACTVEMAILNRSWKVAVIDEVQMTADEFRGWAWTRSFLALQADEIHLCGDPSTLNLIKNLCTVTGDDFEENHYERFKPLTIDSTSLKGDFDYVEAGDCVVAFSRKEIFQVKLEIEQKTKHRCCVVYGALPPETRSQQAKLFNEPGSGYDVLVASDAIGMGLNLNIRRIIFYSLDKFNGEERALVLSSQVKQIAGRAGRRGSLYPEGFVTTFYAADIPYLVECMQQPFGDARSAGLFPVFEQMEVFASQLPDITFGQLLDRFSETCRLDGTYFLCRNDNLKKVAALLDRIEGLSLEDRFNFCFAPVNSRDPRSMGTLQRFASAYSRNMPVRLSMGMPSRTARDNAGIFDLETRHQLLSMYLWLSQHFPNTAFPEKEQAAEMATKIAELLGESLVLFTGQRQLEAQKREQARLRFQQNSGGQKPFVSMHAKMVAMRKQLCPA